jgi:hypothetical protein
MGFGLGILLQVENLGHADEWTLPDDRLGIRTAPLLLLSRPDIQADLKLERAQILGAQNTINELTRRALALRGKTGAAVTAERRAIDQAQIDWLAMNLSRNQLERLGQIELQWEGTAAMLSRPTVAESLRLTPEQRQTLARIIAERNALRARRQSTPPNEQTFNQKARSILSKPQQELWANLLGTPLRFTATGVPPRSRDEATQQAGHTQERR